MAHGTRTFANITAHELPKKPLLSICPDLINECEYLAGTGRNDLYSLVIIICILLNDSHLAENLIMDFRFLFEPYVSSNISFCGKTVFEVFGMPNDIFMRISRFNINRYIK